MNGLLCALGGALIGSAVTFFVTKKAIERKYDSLYQADVDEYKAHVEKKIATDPDFVESVKATYALREKREPEAVYKKESLDRDDIPNASEEKEYDMTPEEKEEYNNLTDKYGTEDEEDQLDEENDDLEFYIGSKEPEPSYDKNAVPIRVTEDYADYCELELEYDFIMYKWKIGESWLSTYDNDIMDLEELFGDRVDILFEDVVEGDTIYIVDDSTHILYNIAIIS